MPLVHKRFIKICPAAVKISREGNRKQTNLPKLAREIVQNIARELRIVDRRVKMAAARLVGWWGLSGHNAKGVGNDTVPICQADPQI